MMRSATTEASTLTLSVGEEGVGCCASAFRAGSAKSSNSRQPLKIALDPAIQVFDFKNIDGIAAVAAPRLRSGENIASVPGNVETDGVGVCIYRAEQFQFARVHDRQAAAEVAGGEDVAAVGGDFDGARAGRDLAGIPVVQTHGALLVAVQFGAALQEDVQRHALDVARVVDGEVDDVLRGLPLACALLVQLVGIEGDVLFLGNELVVVVGLHKLVVFIVAFDLPRDFLHVGRLVDSKLNGLIITDIEDIVHPFIEVEISDAVFIGYHGCGACSFLGISGNDFLRPLCIHGQSREE